MILNIVKKAPEFRFLQSSKLRSLDAWKLGRLEFHFSKIQTLEKNSYEVWIFNLVKSKLRRLEDWRKQSMSKKKQSKYKESNSLQK